MSIVLAGLMLGTASVEAQAVEIRGVISCGRWFQPESGFYKAWLNGFLSGIAFGTNVDILKGTDKESIYLWIDNYCRANPLKDLDDAGLALFDELKRQKRL
jgi:hypothetical protein